jgi:hypothetical protein
LGYNLAKSGSQKKLPLEERRHADFLQLSISSEVLVIQIVQADVVPEALREFLGDDSINLCSAAVDNDVKMLEYYGIAAITGARNLQRMVPNPRTNYPPSMYALSNHYIGMELVKKDHNSIRCDN